MDGIEPQDDSYSIKLEKWVVDTEYANVPTNPTRVSSVLAYNGSGSTKTITIPPYGSVWVTTSSEVYDCTTRKTLYSKKYHCIGINLGGNPIPKTETKTFLVKNK